MPEINMCEDIKILVDEYFHGEISPEDEKLMREQIASCEGCAEYYESERKYYEGIKSAEYKLEINIAEAVMDKIISEKIIINKPAKKRFVPFGLISAAVIVLVMLFASRDNLILVYDNMGGIAQNENSAADSAESIFDSDESGGDMIDGEAYYNMSDGGADYDDEYKDEYGEDMLRAAPEEWEEGTYDIMPEPEEAERWGGDIAEPLMPAAAPIAEAAAAGIWNASDMPVSEIIRIKRGINDDEDFIFSESARAYMLESADGSLFADQAYRQILIADLDRHDIIYEIEDTGIESGYIIIIWE